MATQESEDECPKGHGMIKSNEYFKDKVKTLTGMIAHKDNEIKNMQKTVQLLSSDNKQLQTDNKHAKEKINTISVAFEATATKHMDLANENTILQGDNMELKKQVAQLEEEIKSKDKTIEDTRKQSENLSKELAYRAKSEKKTFEKSNTGWKKQEQKLNGEIQALLKTIENKTLEYACLKSSVDSLESENAFLKQNVGQLREQIRTHQREIRSLGLEKETLLLRLSKVAGANLTYNNPNIADLSDEKRPTKLAEEFSELYDNEWTDAFDKVEGESDEMKTGTLYDLLKLSDEYCKSLSKGHDDAIERAFTTLKYVRALSVFAKAGGEDKQFTNESPITRQKVDVTTSIMKEDDSDSHTQNTKVTDGHTPISQKSNGQEPCETQTNEMVDGFVVLESADVGIYEHHTDKIKQDINTNDYESRGQLEYKHSLASETAVRSNAIRNISESGQIKESNVTEENINDIGTDLDSSRQKETDIDDRNGGTHCSNGANMQQLDGERNVVRYDDTLGTTESSKSDANEVHDETYGCADIGSYKKTKVDQGVPDADTEKIKHAVCDSCGSYSISKVDYKFEELNKEQKKMISDIKKVCEVKQSQDVIRVGARIIAAEMKMNTESEEIMAYISKCIDICWSMHRLTPPVHIDFPSYGTDEPFDTKVYRVYTKSGKRLHFVVWPAIHLHEGGSLLAKGVAQGRN